jgi:protein-L-isoaspartate(D-aspartate) O-methyltransferase
VNDDPAIAKNEFDGMGMTSWRTRERLCKRLQARGIHNQQVLESIGNVPRHLFVDEALASRAYEDIALPLMHGQTISQPYIVARMTEALLEEGRLRKVLEIGTGSGYQTAILAQLVDEVFSIEQQPELHQRAHKRLAQLNIENVRLRLGDGYLGWREQAPFDGILITAAPSTIPPLLYEQLALAGRMVVPVGTSGAQQLLLIKKTLQEMEIRFLEPVSFVPLIPIQPS